ncbi:hypothetical protein O0L34_g19250 [Tuta absoluta]|nr:hypothetical protein O0L34_g19250 [Tuta absoluta]
MCNGKPNISISTLRQSLPPSLNKNYTSDKVVHHHKQTQPLGAKARRTDLQTPENNASKIPPVGAAKTAGDDNSQDDDKTPWQIQRIKKSKKIKQTVSSNRNQYRKQRPAGCGKPEAHPGVGV